MEDARGTRYNGGMFFMRTEGSYKARIADVHLRGNGAGVCVENAEE